MLNINGSNDPNYRYKMEEVVIKNAGYGNGQFTIITNINKIEKSINTPAEIIFKYLAFNLGASYNNKKESLTGVYQNNIMGLRAGIKRKSPNQQNIPRPILLPSDSLRESLSTIT